MALVMSAWAALCLAAPASGEIYRWTDAQGQIHFTENLNRVPPDQREAATGRASQPSKRRVNFSNRGAAAPAPAAPMQRRLSRSRSGTLRIPFTRDGSLMRVEATLNGSLRVPFLIDTGASGVSLPQRYAERLGLGAGRDQDYVRVQTANGIVTRPLVTIHSVEVGGARVENLSATVNPTMPIGLLGGDFFNNFIYQVDAAASVITLRPNENVRGGLSADDWQRRFWALRDPLARLDAHLRNNSQLRELEREKLLRHRGELKAQLVALEREADRLDVPQIWRAE